MEAPAVTPHAESPRALGGHAATAVSPATPVDSDVGEVETEKSPVAAQLKPLEDGAESDRARTDSDDEEEEPHKPPQFEVTLVQGPSTPVEEPTTPVEEPSTPVEEPDEPTTPVGELPPELSYDEHHGTAGVVERELVVQEEVALQHGYMQNQEPAQEAQPSSPVAGSVTADKAEHDMDVQTHEVELVIPSPKRPAPLDLVHHDIDDEASDSEEGEGAGEEDDEEGADLGTPLGYGGAADFGEQDEFASHRFLGPSVASDPSSARALHSLRRVALHDKPPRFVSEASMVPASSGSVTSSGESSGRNSSSASAIHAPDPKTGLRSQSEADYMENPLNTYTLTFTEPVLGFDTNVVVSLENELLVEVWSVDKDSPAQRAGVVVGDYLVSVNGQHIEAHMTKEQVFDIIQNSTLPRTLVFQRDVHDKDSSQSKSLPDKKHSPSKPLMGRLGAAMSTGASIIGSKWKRKKTIVHPNSFCDGCGMDPIVGALWTCSMQALSEAIVQYKLQKKCKHFTPEFLLSLRRDICKGRPDKFEYLGEWIANIVVGTAAAKITVRGIEIPALPPSARQRFVSYLMPLVSNRTDIEVNIEWLPDDADMINAAARASVDRMSVGAYGSSDEDSAEVPRENLEKLRIWISDKKTRTTSPFA
ncbi:ribosomal protein L22 [Phytophthora cinnamomi]|uniref:ribosomal protein L22 n=1 Tax=Phytophthora cinnamomi TaxID=4785 RepID=UPI00355A9FBD|nr:ribosomal protein L22 [Phytophthora cinnamomi]